MMERIVELVVVATLCVLTGCKSFDKVCTNEARAGVSVRITGGAAATGTDAGVTGCVVRVTAAGGTDDFFCRADGADCRCAGAWERQGTYTVTVSSGDHVLDSRSVDVRAGECHVQGVEYTVSLVSDAGSM